MQVCSLNKRAAKVLCRQLGIGDEDSSPEVEEIEGSADRAVWVSSIKCSGDEESIEDCEVEAVAQNECPDNKYAFVTCERPRGWWEWAQGRLLMCVAGPYFSFKLSHHSLPCWARKCGPLNSQFPPALAFLKHSVPPPLCSKHAATMLRHYSPAQPPLALLVLAVQTRTGT